MAKPGAEKEKENMGVCVHGFLVERGKGRDKQKL